MQWGSGHHAGSRLMGGPGWIAVMVMVVWFGAADAKLVEVGGSLGDDPELIMVLSFGTTGPTEDVARQELRTVLDGVVGSHADLEAVVGDASVVNQTGLWLAVGNVTLVGGPEELLAVEQQNGLAGVDVVGEGWFGSITAGSVGGFGERAASMMLAAVTSVVVGVGLVATFVRLRVWGLGAVFGLLLGMACVVSLAEYLQYVRYAV